MVISTNIVFFIFWCIYFFIIFIRNSISIRVFKFSFISRSIWNFDSYSWGWRISIFISWSKSDSVSSICWKIVSCSFSIRIISISKIPTVSDICSFICHSSKFYWLSNFCRSFISDNITCQSRFIFIIWIIIKKSYIIVNFRSLSIIWFCS